MTKYYHKILMPIDGSEQANLACVQALGLAKCNNAELILLHCFGEIPAIIGGEARMTVLHDCEEAAKKLMQPFEQRCMDQRVQFRSLIRAGAPGRTIVHVCKEEACDLIVMGSRGLSNVSGFALGSVSQRVLQHVPVPVLIVR